MYYVLGTVLRTYLPVNCVLYTGQCVLCTVHSTHPTLACVQYKGHCVMCCVIRGICLLSCLSSGTGHCPVETVLENCRNRTYSYSIWPKGLNYFVPHFKTSFFLVNNLSFGGIPLVSGNTPIGVIWQNGDSISRSWIEVVKQTLQLFTFSLPKYMVKISRNMPDIIYQPSIALTPYVSNIHSMSVVRMNATVCQPSVALTLYGVSAISSTNTV